MKWPPITAAVKVMLKKIWQRIKLMQHHECDWGFVCACDIGNSALDDEEWIPSSQSYDGFLTEKETLSPFLSTDELINDEQQIRIGQYDPPLWLLYDTFLM